MGAIEEIYEDLDADVELEEFREAVEAKIEQMGGLADEETAAMLVAHEASDGEVEGIADVEAGMEEVKFVAEVTSVGDIRTFERDEEDAEDGRVLNAQVADETGSIRITFWDEAAVGAEEELDPGDGIRLAGRPKEGYDGVEVNVDKVELEPELDLDVQTGDDYAIEDLAMGLSDVTVQAVVLETDSIRTFDRDDGSEGRVSNLLVGDETGRVRVTLWDGQADRATELDAGATVEIVDGYVRERDGDLELHVGDRGAVDEIDETVEFEPEATPVDAVEMGDTVDLVGVLRSVDEKRTFERDDGSEGQVRNVRLQDDSGDIRVALWGEKADLDVGPGDQVLVVGAEIQDGWQDDLEASAGWQSTVVALDDDVETPDVESDDADDADDAEADADAETGLSAFGDGGTAGDDSAGATSVTDGDDSAGATSVTDGDDSAGATSVTDGETTAFTGVVVQAGDPVILDDGEETVSVDASADVTLGEEVTVRGTYRDGRIDADEVR